MSAIVFIYVGYVKLCLDQRPTLGAHAHAHAHQCPCPWVLGGHGCGIIVRGWAWVGIAAILVGMGGHGFHIIMGGHGFH